MCCVGPSKSGAAMVDFRREAEFQVLGDDGGLFDV